VGGGVTGGAQISLDNQILLRYIYKWSLYYFRILEVVAMKKVSIEQVEPRFAQQLEAPLKAVLKQLGYSIPDGFRLRISLLQCNGRKKRSNAAAGTWVPEKSEPGQFWLEPVTEDKTAVSSGVSNPAEIASVSTITGAEVSRTPGSSGVEPHSAKTKLLRALDRAESTPGWSFVSLKRFRDDILPMEPFAPGESKFTDVEWQDVLRAAIEERLILTRKVLNPKSPQFPVTSIRLNRMMPEVQQVLGQPKRNLDFHPIRIKGEPLSATVLRERR
jgi:hypothetical protein